MQAYSPWFGCGFLPVLLCPGMLAAHQCCSTTDSSGNTSQEPELCSICPLRSVFLPAVFYVGVLRAWLISIGPDPWKLTCALLIASEAYLDIPLPIVLWICSGLFIYTHLDSLILIVDSLWPIRNFASQFAVSVEMLIAPVKGSNVLNSKVPVKCWVSPFCCQEPALVCYVNLVFLAEMSLGSPPRLSISWPTLFCSRLPLPYSPWSVPAAFIHGPQ